jgi:hypothetical protein
MRVMLKSLLIVSTVLGFASFTATSAQAGDCRVDPNDPMVTSESFGLSTCRERGPRYHIHDFAGEAARGYAQASSDDPMVWSSDQWRSDLMGGYSETSHAGYDNRFERGGHVGHHVVRKMVRIKMDIDADNADVAIAKRKGARMVSLDGKIRTAADTSITRGAHGRCQGILVIRYGEGSRCLNRKPVPVEPRGKPKLIPKMG